jgi:hypothetical protein
MYSPLQINQMAMDDYHRALRQAQKHRVTNLVLRRKNNLLSLEAVLARARVVGQRSLGINIVAMDEIIGSAGRAGDFDRDFMPRQQNTMDRWLGVVRAWYRGIPLPPVELRKVNDAYFVVDGHHRISVARLRGQVFIEAEVTEMDVEGDLGELCCAH